jgi:hypothetical protein
MLKNDSENEKEVSDDDDVWIVGRPCLLTAGAQVLFA